MAGTTKVRAPLWLSNLLVFSLVFVAVMFYFLWQIRQATDAFLKHAAMHSELVAEVIELNARGAIRSEQVIEEIIEAFLGNTARFVDYLESVEPFVSAELTGFAEEAGLAGIRIAGGKDTYVEGPLHWCPGLSGACEPGPALRHREADHLYLLSLPRRDGPGCVVVGLEAGGVEALQRELGLTRLTEALSKLPGMRYVRVDPAPAQGPAASADSIIALRVVDGIQVAETRLQMPDAELVIGLNAGHLAVSIRSLWRDFGGFSLMLVCLAGLLSFVLYQLQRAHLHRVRAYERALARQNEDASLGRAAAAIAHELRNPLNALGMGLQRLEIEGNGMDPDHGHLVRLMLDAVQRTNGIVINLLRYARPPRPERRAMYLDRLVEDLMDLHMPRCKESGIEVARHMYYRGAIEADPALLRHVVENLLTNAIDAQPHGGTLAVEVASKGEDVVFTVKNRGFALPPDQVDKILEPYFSTKADGTGLGLSIAQRMVRAHGGRIEIMAGEDTTLKISVYLPLVPGGGTDESTGNGEIAE